MRMTLNKYKKALIALVAILCTFAFAASSCENDTNSKSRASESKVQQDSYDALTENQPAVGMSYSPTRDTINKWNKLWGQKGKPFYLYLVSGGTPYAFAVMAGPPVSFCVGLTPPEQVIRPEIPGDDDAVLSVPAPGVDGAFYSGANCDRYYGFDATTGGYFEFTAGADTTLVGRDQPYALNLYADALPLGDTDAQQSQAVPETVEPPAPE